MLSATAANRISVVASHIVSAETQCPFAQMCSKDETTRTESEGAGCPLYTNGQTWFVDNYDTATTILSNSTTLSANRDRILNLPPALEKKYGVISAALKAWLAFSDDPTHEELKKYYTSKFTLQFFNSLDGFIQDTMNVYVDKISSKAPKKVEWVNEFAVPVAVTVICKIIGFPIDDFLKVKKYSNSIAYFIGKVTTNEAELEEKCKAVHSTFTEMVAYVRSWVSHYRKSPADCFISNTLHDPKARDITEHHGEDLFVYHIIDLMFAGHGNISNLLAGGLAQLLLPQNRKYFENLKKDRNLASDIVEEMVRLVSPTHRLSRVVKENQTIEGKSMNTGSAICVNVLKANYDPQAFPNPTQMDPSRSSAAIKHLSFGYGGHLCVGRNLARLQAKIMLLTISKKLPNLALEKIEFGENATFRMVEKAHFTF